VSGENVSIVLQKKQLHKAVNVIHGELFGISRKINIAIFGKGNVGEALINQITKSVETIEKRKGIKLNIFAIANSKKVLLNANGATADWLQSFEEKAVSYDALDTVIAFAKANHLGNLIAVDNTASERFTENYLPLVEAGFDLVSSNKIANTIGLKFYETLRESLEKHQKTYLYETNVGAGLPLIDTIKLLHLSGENITRIRGIFSGSLSYIFNTFCQTDAPISESILKAQELGFTEPDPRIDLSGTDVARKLLILARELDLKNELDDVKILNLIPEHLRAGDASNFLEQITDLDPIYAERKSNLKADEVLRYVGDLSGDLSQDTGAELSVKLETVNKSSPLGALQGSDTIFEIYTESYGDQPIVIQGAGAGALVTARGVFGDILRLSEKLSIQ
jgi:homoserine dehydrogenase